MKSDTSQACGMAAGRWSALAEAFRASKRTTSRPGSLEAGGLQGVYE